MNAQIKLIEEDLIDSKLDFPISLLFNCVERRWKKCEMCEVDQLADKIKQRLRYKVVFVKTNPLEPEAEKYDLYNVIILNSSSYVSFVHINREKEFSYYRIRLIQESDLPVIKRAVKFHQMSNFL